MDEDGQPKVNGFELANGILRMNDRIYVPRDEELRQLILDEAHRAKYTVHLGATKMYRDLREVYWWPGMKRGIARYVAHCDTCQRIKAEHQRPDGLMQPLEIPE